MMWLWGLFWFF